MTENEKVFCLIGAVALGGIWIAKQVLRPSVRIDIHIVDSMILGAYDIYNPTSETIYTQMRVTVDGSIILIGPLQVEWFRIGGLAPRSRKEDAIEINPSDYGIGTGRHIAFVEVKDSLGNIYKSNTVQFFIP